jgi:hypothetical protein
LLGRAVGGGERGHLVLGHGAPGEAPHGPEHDPGYYLIASGRRAFEKDIGFRIPVTDWLARASSRAGIVGYVAAIAFITLFIQSYKRKPRLTVFITLIIAVIDGGTDYEYRFVGDAERQSFNRDFKGMRVSQVEEIAPRFGEIIRATYDKVRTAGLPFAARGLADHVSTTDFLPYHETAFLPLGVADDAVDHLLVVGVNIERPVSQTTR